jgi:hypothetical protein
MSPDARGTMRPRLLEQVLQSCLQEYADKQNTFAQIDTKAQTTASVAGVLIAAALAFVQADSVARLVGAGGLKVVALFALAIILLLASTLFCLLAMRIRRVTAPLESKELGKMVDDILGSESAKVTAETFDNFVRDQITAWQKCLRSLRKANTDKARRTLWAQALLGAALLLVAIVVLLFLLSFALPARH